MVKRVCVVWLMLVSVVSAGTSWIELVPETPGPYAPGALVNVDVIFHFQEEVEYTRMRLFTLDFTDTDANLNLPDAFHFEFSPPLVSDHLWVRFEVMPKVHFVSIVCGPVAGFCLDMRHSESVGLGTLAVRLPDHPGVYVLDAANRDAPDSNAGARVDYGDNSRTTLHWLNGNLAGGQIAMTVVPEPGTMVLIMVGGFGWAASRSRRVSTERLACNQSP